MRHLVKLLLFAPLPALAEVLDKEFSIGSLALLAVVGSSITFASATRKPKWLFVVLPVLALIYASHLLELSDPYVGLAMQTEGGTIYVVMSWLGPALCLLALVLAMAIKRHDKKNLNSS
jgi:hypothetical protein